MVPQDCNGNLVKSNLRKQKIHLNAMFHALVTACAILQTYYETIGYKTIYRGKYLSYECEHIVQSYTVYKLEVE